MKTEKDSFKNDFSIVRSLLVLPFNYALDNYFTANKNQTLLSLRTHLIYVLSTYPGCTHKYSQCRKPNEENIEPIYELWQAHHV